MTRPAFNFIKIVLFIFCSAVAAQQESLPFDQYGPIKANETLWSIAKKYTVEGKSVEQTSRSIFEANPEAFKNSNINLLQKGAVLKIPRQMSTAKKSKSINQRANTSIPAVAQSEENVFGTNTSHASTSPAKTKAGEKPSGNTSIINNREMGSTVTSAGDAVAAMNTGLQDEPEKNSQLPDEVKNEIQSSFGYELAIINDNNIGRAKYPEDIRDDTILNLSLSGKGLMKLTTFSHLSLGAHLEMEKYSDFERLDNVRYAFKLKYSFAFASGFLSPVYALKLDLGGIQSDSSIRTSKTVNLGLQMNKWISDSLMMILGYNHRIRNADSEVYDTRENRVFANLDIELSRKNLAYLSFSYIAGDIVSSATPRPLIIDIADAIEADDAFSGNNGNLIAYRLDANSIVYTLGFNSVLTRSMSADISLRYIDSEASQSDSVYYDRTIIRAGLLGRF